jgi:hypothetical protein
MALHQAVDGGDCVHVWRVASNILDRQLQTICQQQLSSMGIGWWDKSLPQKTACCEVLHGALDPGSFFEAV